MVLVEQREGVSIVKLNRPERRNTISHDFRFALIDALTEAIHANTSAIILTGADGCFSGGGDLSRMADRDLSSARKRMMSAGQVVRLLRHSAKPTIAAVEGIAYGAGFSMALACDQIVASANARFCAAFVKAGLIPDYGMMHLLPARCGDGLAKRLMMTGTVLVAKEAFDNRVVDELVPAGTALEAALALARKFQGVAPLPLALMKAAWATGRTATLEDTLTMEVDMQSVLFTTTDFQEVLEAFKAKRSPVFKGI